MPGTAREVGDKGRQSAACRNLALSFYEVGDYIKSIESSKEELAIAREEGNRKRSIGVRSMFWTGLICASEDTNRVLSTAKKH